jgi:hypothetical protein
MKQEAVMKMTFLAALSTFLILTLTGCGSDNNPGPPLLVSEILSDSTFDGDIQLDSFLNLLTVSQGSIATEQRLFAGLDPFITDLEYRAFLHFPLTGVNGVPGDAIIESAFLDIFINDVVTQFPTDTIPLRIDLVLLPSPFLVGTFFDFPEQLSLSIRPAISRADMNSNITIDVTPLMIEAQRLNLADFQIRIMEDFGIVVPGLIEINDTTGGDRSLLAPLLTVSYF